jgi:mono/diheme cytochrome c family protein
MSEKHRRWKLPGIGIAVPTIAAAAIFVHAQAFSAEPAVVQSGDPDPEDVVTFTRDVAPILQQNCQLCHQPGSVGPMSLMTYEQVRPWAPLIREEVVSRNMPPYHYDTGVGIQELKGDKRLSERDIETIVRWVEGGMPMGDPADLPPPVEWPDAAEWRLAAEFGQPDVVIPTTPFTVPARGSDLWWQPVVESGITEDRCIRAIEVKPSVPGRAATHHANSTFRVQNDDGQWVAGGRLTEYALGKLGEIVPEDACRIAPANSRVAWDVHYYPSGEVVENDVVEVGLWLYPPEFDRESLHRQTLNLYFLQGGDYDIPPHGTLMTQGFHSFSTPVRVDSFQPHGHLRMVASSLEIFYPGTGRREMVSMVSNWNPGWHLSHIYEDHVAPLVPAGAVLIVTKWYDNTADNKFNPDPDQWVGTGNRAADEMAHAWIAITHLDDAGYEKLLAQRGGDRPTRGPRSAGE